MIVADLFARDIRRKINPVVQVEDQHDAALISEVSEYVVTPQIAKHFVRLIENGYLDREPRGIAIWISGFFGSGKSLFLKLLALMLAQQKVAGVAVTQRIADNSDDEDFKRAIRALENRKPARVVALHMKTDAHEREEIVPILWRRLHESFGYSRIPWIAEIERSLKKRGLLDALMSAVEAERGSPWHEVRNDPLLQHATLVKALGLADPLTYSTARAAEQAIADARAQERQLLTVSNFTARALELIKEDSASDRLFFALDEMGQFAAHDSQLLLELTAIVEKFLSEGNGKLWLAATAQEKLDKVIENYADVQHDIAKIRDRFVGELRVDLTAENAERVVLQRLLSKSSEKREALRTVLAPHAAWLEHETFLPDIVPELQASKLEAVLDSYPFVPSQFRLITMFMQGLANDTGGTADRTAKGPRALVGVTQQIASDLADEELGALVSLDRVYDAMAGSSVPSEDVELIHSLDGESAKPARAAAVVRIDYLLDQIGERYARATEANLVRGSWRRVSDDSHLTAEATRSALAFLVAKSFVRETGGSGQLTYRFLKAYQRKIEDEVASEPVSKPEIREETRVAVRDVLEGLRIGRGRVAYHGAREFSLAPVIDGEHVASDERLRIVVRSPGNEDETEPKVESLTGSAVVWAAALIPSFADEMHAIIATGRVLARHDRPTTEYEREQMRRASDDLDYRKNKRAERIREALLDGELYVCGQAVVIKADVADAIVETVVEREYFGLRNAPYGVDENDVAALFAATLPKAGPLLNLKLVQNGALSDSGPLANDLLNTLDGLHYKGGASGRDLMVKMLAKPLGYGQMQTFAATAALWKIGAVKAFSSGVPLSRTPESEKRMTRVKEFEKLTFEREKSIDPVKLSSASSLLAYRFERNGPLELPRIVRDLSGVRAELVARIKLIEAVAGRAIPQVADELKPLRLALATLDQAEGDVALVEAFTAHHAIYDAWKMVLEPFGKLDITAVADIGAARAMTESPVAASLEPGKVKQLSALLDGPKPWNDLIAIRSLRTEISGRLRTEATARHAARDAALDSALAEIELRATEVGADDVSRTAANGKLAPYRCEGAEISGDGRCGRCRATVENLPLQLAALPTLLNEALMLLQPSPQLRDIDDGGALPRPRAAISVRKSIGLPRLVRSEIELDALLGQLRGAACEALAQGEDIELGT
jgi:hypothetical protein